MPDTYTSEERPAAEKPKKSDTPQSQEGTGKAEKNKERAGTQEKLEDLKDDVRTRFSTINDGVALPYNLVLKKKKKNAPVVTFDDVKEAAGRGQWGAVVTSSFRLFYRGSNEVEALGYFSQGVENLDTRKRLGVLRQMENADQKNMTAEQKLKTAILRTETDYLRAKEGLQFSRKAETDGKPKKIQANQRIRDLVKPEVLKDIEAKKIYGALVMDDILPEGAYLHCEKDTGYPLYVTPTENGTVPSISLYEKKSGTALKGRTERDKKIEYLKQTIPVGAVLFPNEPEGNKGMFKRYFVSMGRLVQAGNKAEEDFFSLHVMVYMGNGKIRHVGGKGGEEMTLEYLFSKRGRNQNSIAVGTFPDKSTGAEFAKKCEEFSKSVTSYSKQDAIKLAKNVAAQKVAKEKGERVDPRPTTKKKKKSAICVDMVQFAAHELNIPGVKDAQTPLEMFKAMNIEYAMAV